MLCPYAVLSFSGCFDEQTSRHALSNMQSQWPRTSGIWQSFGHYTPADKALPPVPAIIALNAKVNRGRLHEIEDAFHQALLILELSSQHPPELHSALPANTPGDVVVHQAIARTAPLWVCIAFSSGMQVMLKHPPITWESLWVITVTVRLHWHGGISAPIVPRSQFPRIAQQHSTRWLH